MFVVRMLGLAFCLAWAGEASACPFLSQWQTLNAKEDALAERYTSSLVSSLSSNKTCAPADIATLNEWLSLKRQAQSLLNRAKNDPSCKVKNIDTDGAARVQREIEKCRQALAREQQPAQAQSSPPPQAPPPPRQQAAASAPAAAAAPRAPQQGSCSDISGTGGARMNCPQPQANAVGLACGQASNCLTQAKWTFQKPFNQSRTPLAFRQFHGPEVSIPSGYSLWSVPDATAPTKRRLEARQWSGKPKTGGRCANEYLDATSRAFEVRVECETERQARLHREFEEREDAYPYMDVSDCRSPWKVQMTADWQQRSLDYWKARPSEPVGWCVGPVRDGRQDKRPLREPKWRTAQQCSDSVESLPISVNGRGVRGCTSRGE